MLAIWQGLELLSSLLHGGREMQVQEPLPLYKACVTVLARALQDKVVPVFLPALQLLVDVYSDDFLAKLPSGMPLDPLPLFARQLVLRSGSSNVRNSCSGSTPYSSYLHTPFQTLSEPTAGASFQRRGTQRQSYSTAAERSMQWHIAIPVQWHESQVPYKYRAAVGLYTSPGAGQGGVDRGVGL